MPAPIKADELFAAWSRKQWKSVYLFAGQEDLLIEEAIDKACANWLPGDPTGLNRDRMDAEDHSVGEIITAAQTMPFMGGNRVVQVANVSQLKAADAEALAEFITSLPAEVYLLLVWGREWRRDDLRKSLVEAVSEVGQVVIFWPPFPEQAQRWAIERARRYKKTLEPEAAAWLVEEGGEGLRLLDAELAKVSQYVGERPSITIEDIQASFGFQRSSSAFEWIDAVRAKQRGVALGLLDRLLSEGEEPLQLLALLSRNLRDWLSAKASAENPALLAMRFRVRRGEERRFAQQLNAWTDDELVSGLEGCLAVEQAIKTGKETPEMALTLLCLRLGGQPADALR